jgi:hypothetical protein
LALSGFMFLFISLFGFYVMLNFFLFFFLALGYQFYVECHLGAFGYQFYQFLYLVFLICSIFVLSPKSFKLYVIVNKICIGP